MLELTPSVCALFGSHRMPVLGFEKTVFANYTLPALKVVCSIILYPSLPLSLQLLFTTNLLSSSNVVYGCGEVIFIFYFWFRIWVPIATLFLLFDFTTK